MPSQCEILKQHFDSGRRLTVAEALSEYGIYALSQRCGELRRDGYPLASEMVETPTGKRIAQYYKAQGQLSLIAA